MADAVGIELPIAATVADLLSDEVTVDEMLARLMLRPPRSELHGIDTREEARPACTR